jgi:hypothetical protein
MHRAFRSRPGGRITDRPYCRNHNISLTLAKEYADDIKSDRWNTQKEASLALKVARSNFVRTVRISRFPVELLPLFRSDDLTFRVGRRLLLLSKSTGLDALLDRASMVSVDRRQLSSTAAHAAQKCTNRVENLSTAFAGTPVRDARRCANPSDVKEIAITFHMNSKGHAAHIRLTGPNIALLSKNLDEVKAWWEVFLARE